MTEQQAIKKAFEITAKADDRLLTKADGEKLLLLEKHIEKEKFNSIWSAFLTSSDNK